MAAIGAVESQPIEPPGVALSVGVGSALHAQGKPAVDSVNQAFIDVDLAHVNEDMNLRLSRRDDVTPQFG
jgi:hypothetical protein